MTGNARPPLCMTEGRRTSAVIVGHAHLSKLERLNDVHKSIQVLPSSAQADVIMQVLTVL